MTIDRPVRRQVAQDAWDVSLGTLCLVVALVVHLGEGQAVARNLDPSAFSVLLTTLAVGPLVVRRRHPLAVLVLTLAGLLALVATRNTVGASTVGCTVAFYTAISSGSRRDVRTAAVVMTVGVAVGLLLRPVDLSPSGALTTLVVLVSAGVLATGVRQRRERFDAEVAATRSEAARAASEERLRITRDLHDVIGHSLSLMVVQAGVAERLLASDPEQARAAIAQVGATGRASLQEIRQLLTVLRDGGEEVERAPRRPVPTLALLPDLLARVEDAGLPTTLSVEGTAIAPHAGIELAAYRIVQEALTNCLKHAGAGRAEVGVRHAEDALTVTVSDDGRGGDAATATGHGIAGMRERVAVYGGELSVGPGAGRGFRVHARFPLGGGR